MITKPVESLEDIWPLQAELNARAGFDTQGMGVDLFLETDLIQAGILLQVVDDTPEHREWLRRIAGDLVKTQDECGALREELGTVGKGSYAPPVSNEAYGTREAPLIQENTDALSTAFFVAGSQATAGWSRRPRTLVVGGVATVLAFWVALAYAGRVVEPLLR